MRTTILLCAWLLATLSSFGANPDYRAFRGTGGIFVTTNPPTGLIIIDGSGVFTSSGTNATIAVSTNGVLVMAAATNINFIKGTNVVLTATNIGSTAHVGIHTITPLADRVAEGQSITVTTNGVVYTVAAGLKDFQMSGTNQFVWSNGTALVLSPTNGALYFYNTNDPINIPVALIFSDGETGAGFRSQGGTLVEVITVASNLFPGTWQHLGSMRMRQITLPINAVDGRFLRSDNNGAAQWAEVLTISNFVSLSSSNATSKPLTNSVNSPGIVTVFGLQAGTNVILSMNASNIVISSSSGNSSVAPPLNSVQFNSNNVQQGSADFLFANGVATVGQGVEVTTGSFVLNGGTTALVAWNGLGRIRWDADGVMRLENDAANNFNRINFRDNTAASPALGVTNGDFIVLGGNGNFKIGGSTNKLIVPAVHIANDGGVGTPLLSLDNPLSAIRWDVAIDSNPQTYFLGLGRVGDTIPTMVWELGGNVGINTTNPATALDVQGRTMLRSNIYFPNISSNALPVALLATDSQGEVYETAFPTVGASAETNSVLTNIIGTVARNVTNVVSLSTTNETSKPLTNAYANGTLTLFGVEAGANVTITPNGSNLVIAATASSSGSATNEVLTNLVGTAGRNVTNVVSLSTTNATSKPLTNSFANGVLTLFGVEAGANVTITPNGSNLVIAATSSSGGASTNEVLTNLVGTVARNITNFVSLSTSNATSKPLTNSYAAGVVTVFGVEAGANITVTPNGSNLVIAATGGGSSVAPPISSVQFNSNGVMQGSSGFVYTNGNVGIGIANPTVPFHAAGSIAIVAGVTNYDNYSGGLPGVVGGAGLWISGGTEALSFYAGGGPKWRIDSTGNLIAITDSVYSIGATEASRPANVFVASRVVPEYVTASRMAAFHTDKTITNTTTTRVQLDNFFAMGITNITNFGSGIAIRTNGGTLTISNTQSGEITVSGHTNAIPFINPAANGFTYIDAYSFGSLTNPGFGFVPKVGVPAGGGQAGQAGYGGLLVFANDPMGLVTIGHPNPGGDFTTFSTALVISNRYQGAGDFKNEMVKIDAVLVNGTTLQADSTMTRWRVWQASGASTDPSTSSNDVAELTIGGRMSLYGGTLYPSNSLAFVAPTAAELGVGGYWVGRSNASLVTIYSLNGSSTAMKVLAP